MFRFRYRISDAEWTSKVIRSVETVTPEMRKFAKKKVRPFITKSVKHILGVPPGQPSYPLDWQSGIQMLMFFITRGFGKGIPYRRTDELVNSWVTRGRYTEGKVRISVYNDDPKATWVVGENQQDFHTKTGWPYAPSEISNIFDDAWDMIIAYSDELAGRITRD
jgi:hypothetical protein